MRNKSCPFVIFSSIIQQIFYLINQVESKRFNFLSGVPLTDSVGYHLKFFGYWYLPVFFILLYFSGYISRMEKYEVISVVRYRTRKRYFIKRMCILLLKLLELLTVQIIVYMIRDFFWDGFIQNKKIDCPNFNMLSFLVYNYYLVMLILIVFENTFEILFPSFNWNLIVNIIVIVCVFMYNYIDVKLKNAFRWLNLCMYERVESINIADYVFLIFLLIGLWSLSYYQYKRMDFLGRIKYD